MVFLGHARYVDPDKVKRSVHVEQYQYYGLRLEEIRSGGILSVNLIQVDKKTGLDNISFFVRDVLVNRQDGIHPYGVRVRLNILQACGRFISQQSIYFCS